MLHGARLLSLHGRQWIENRRWKYILSIMRCIKYLKQTFFAGSNLKFLTVKSWTIFGGFDIIPEDRGHDTNSIRENAFI